MKVHFNGFWDGFLEKSNKNHVEFLLDLLSKVFNEECLIGSFDESNILVESLFGPSVLKSKHWNYTFLFSGESRLRENSQLYNVVLYGERNHDNVINCPLFMSYNQCNNFQATLENIHTKQVPEFPNKDVLAIISNPSGHYRNHYLSQIEAAGIQITYAGRFKNNVGGNLAPEYGTPEFQDYVSQFKCIIAAENSEGDTYITEKICHGFLSQTIPLYWGSKNVCDYFNKQRFFNLRDQSIDQLKKIISNYETWSSYIREPVFAKNVRTIDDIAEDISYLIFKPQSLARLSGVYAICNENFEPQRFHRLTKMFSEFKWNVKFRGTTYKHTITPEMFQRYVKTNEITNLRGYPPVLKKAELSITLNFIEILKEIQRNYSSGLFFICESDIYLHGNVKNISPIIDITTEFDKDWDGIHIGWDRPNPVNTFDYAKNGIGIQRNFSPRGMDSIIYSYPGIIKILEHVKNEDFSVPWDYVFWNLLKKNDFKFYWSNNEVFIQGTNAGMERSTIQTDMS